MTTRPRKPVAKEKPLFSIHTVPLTAEEVQALHRLSRDASNFLGRSISNSAVIRALIRQVAAQRPPASE